MADKGDEFGTQGACVSSFVSRLHTSGSRISKVLAIYTPLLTQGTEIIVLLILQAASFFDRTHAIPGKMNTITWMMNPK